MDEVTTMEVESSVMVGDEVQMKDIDDDDDDDRYFIGRKEKSMALIFNQIQFENDLDPRPNARLDGERLKKVLEKLNFDVHYHEDLTRKDLLQEIQKAKKGHENRDCLLVTVMTHGEDGGWLYAKDYQYRDEEVWGSFEAEEAPSLKGKPKIFLFQCCRGSKTDDGARLQLLSSGPPKMPPTHPPSNEYLEPKNADFFIVHSAPAGYSSWKSPDGAWLIQDFCTQLEKHAAKRDLEKIMLLVANCMSKRLCKPEVGDEGSKKQVPVITTTFTKLMYFCDPTQSTN